jgi:rubrerythrin
MSRATSTDSIWATTPAGACELFCGECGYGIVVRREPPACPMCRSASWSERPASARWN